MSKNSIRLSEKHGVNPSLLQCFFCGESKGIALMGKLPNDEQAPHQCVMDYEPCDKCIENMNLGVTLIEVTNTQPTDGRPPLKAKDNVEVYPLGRWCVLTTEAVERLFNHKLKNGAKLFVDSEIMSRLLEDGTQK